MKEYKLRTKQQNKEKWVVLEKKEEAIELANLIANHLNKKDNQLKDTNEISLSEWLELKEDVDLLFELDDNIELILTKYYGFCELELRDSNYLYTTSYGSQGYSRIQPKHLKTKHIINIINTTLKELGIDKEFD